MDKSPAFDFERLMVELHEGGPVNHVFMLVGGPIDELGSGLKAFTAYGHAAAAWARLEKHLEILLVHINKTQHSPTPLDLFNPNHPRSVSDKLDLLRRYFNQHPALSEHTDSFRSLATEIKSAADDRNLYLHSILERYDEADDTIFFKTIEASGPKGSDNFTITTQRVPYEVLLGFAVTIVKLNRRLAEITTTIFTPDALERLRKQ